MNKWPRRHYTSRHKKSVRKKPEKTQHFFRLNLSLSKHRKCYRKCYSDSILIVTESY